jgi:hypothetical protein
MFAHHCLLAEKRVTTPSHLSRKNCYISSIRWHAFIAYMWVCYSTAKPLNPGWTYETRCTMLSPLSATWYQYRSLHVADSFVGYKCTSAVSPRTPVFAMGPLLSNLWRTKHYVRFFSKNFCFVRGLCPLSTIVIPPVFHIHSSVRGMDRLEAGFPKRRLRVPKRLKPTWPFTISPWSVINTVYACTLSMDYAVFFSPFAETRYDPWPVHVGFVVDKVVLGQEYLRVLPFSLSVWLHQWSILFHSSITDIKRW